MVVVVTAAPPRAPALRTGAQAVGGALHRLLEDGGMRATSDTAQVSYIYGLLSNIFMGTVFPKAA